MSSTSGSLSHARGDGAVRPRTPRDELSDHLSPRKTELWWYYELGRLTRACLAAPGEGCGGVKALAKAVGVSDTLLYRTMRFYRGYEPAEVRRLDSLGFEWNKVARLLAVKDPADRLDLQEEAIRDGLTYRELEFRLADRFGYARPPCGRAPAPLPRHGVAVYVWMLATNCRLARRDHAATAGVLARAVVDFDEAVVLDPKFAADLEDAASELAGLLENLTDVYEVLRRVRGRLGELRGRPRWG